MTDANWRQRLIDGQVGIDLRAPGEFAKGALPGAVNHPILTDQERHLVGCRYREAGADAARQLGMQLVDGSEREARIDAWIRTIRQSPASYIYCWRGGERSAIAESWLQSAGCRTKRVPGGYKALRHLCLQAIEAAIADAEHWWVLAGRTGSGKTTIINHLARAIDLEGLANHRGSAFGGRFTPQPAQATFENALAVDLLRLGAGRVILEDESRAIGSVHVPPAMHDAMQRAPLAVVELPLEDRVANIKREYVDEALKHTSTSSLHDKYAHALQRISRRLGGVRHKELLTLLQRGFEENDHHPWIETLLKDYYDPMYDYQLGKKQERVRIQGNADEILEQLN